MNGTKIGNKIYRPLMAQVYHNADEIEEIKAKIESEGKTISNIDIQRDVIDNEIYLKFTISYTDGTSEIKSVKVDESAPKYYHHSIKATFQDTRGTTDIVFSFEDESDSAFSTATTLFSALQKKVQIIPVIILSPSYGYASGFGNMTTTANVTLYGYFSGGSSQAPAPINYTNLQNKTYLGIEDTVTSA